jgi:transposase
MEATGVYHESLAYYLDEQGHEVSIVLPNKISNFARTLDTKTVTDKTASEAIALFGLSRTLDRWTKPSGIYREIRHLTRERNQLIDERTILKNQLHAEKAQADPCKKSVERITTRIALIDKQEKEIKAELSELIKKDEQVKTLVPLLCSLPGVAMVTACSVLAETDGFDLVRNRRQLASYAGLDVREKQSGTSVKGKPRISKKGNKYLRRSMHMAALTALRSDERFKGLFIRLVSRHGIKMKAVVAVQRKLLELMFTLYKTNQPYNKNYLSEVENRN